MAYKVIHTRVTALHEAEKPTNFCPNNSGEVDTGRDPKSGRPGEVMSTETVKKLEDLMMSDS